MNVYTEIVSLLSPFFPGLMRKGCEIGLTETVSDEVDLDVWEEYEAFFVLARYSACKEYAPGLNDDAYIFIGVDMLLDRGVPTETVSLIISLARQVCRVVVSRNKKNAAFEEIVIKLDHIQTKANPTERLFHPSDMIFFCGF